VKALIQRVSDAQVSVDGQVIGLIGRGLLVLLGVERDDAEPTVDKMLDRILNYRVFPDSADKMNLSVSDIQGELLVVSQFTLAADTSKGRRPGFSSAAAPELAELLYERFVDAAKQHGLQVSTGQFAANMQVNLTNDGPVTFLLEV